MTCFPVTVPDRATCREETEGITANVFGVSFEDDGNILKLDHGNGCTTF